ncbi:MAG TPA: HAD-IA family hydrolase [Candidatus Limnocylindrales bacterium]|nr:HAD-IA family hydrolase [Candidatus Limnocylindrales bacterium]
MAASVCVFDLDHTLVSSPLDLRAVGREMEAFVRERGVPLPTRELRWSAPEMLALVRREAPHLERDLLAIPVSHERAAMAAAILEPFAVETVAAMRQLGHATAIWTNNDRVVADFVLGRLGLAPHLDLVVTRDDVAHLKPDPDGLRVVRGRWPDAEHIVVVGDAWVDGAAANAGGVPFIAYRADHEELARRGVTIAAAINSLLDLPAALA